MAIAWSIPMRCPPASLQSHLLVTYLALALLGLGGLIAWTGHRLELSTLEQAERELVLHTLLIADGLADPLDEQLEHRRPPNAALQSLLDSYARTSDSQVTIYDVSLQHYFSSERSAGSQSWPDTPELIAARDGQPRAAIRRDSLDGGERIFAAAPVAEEDGRPLGFVQLSRPTAPLRAEIRRTWLSLLLAGGLILALLALASLLLARRIGTPIRNLTATSELLAAGQLERRAEPAGPAEVRRLGLAFNRMADQLQSMLVRQRSFVADAAHELRSPLTSLRLRIELLRDRGRDDPELQRRYLTQIEGEIERLQSTLDHLLSLAALDESERPPRTPTDLAPLLYELADALGPLVHQAGLQLQTDIPPHLPAVSANPEQLRIAVRNLLDNAIKYTPEGGRIELRARPAEARSELLISVADTGVGIPPDDLPHVFERFYRADKARSRRQGGIGLGLALVRGLIEAHGGQVEAASKPGRGSIFTVRLPLESSATSLST